MHTLFMFTNIILGVSVANNCTNNSHWENCPCDQPTCSQRTYSPNFCADCKASCVCDDGYLLDEMKKICVLPNGCKQIGKCQENAEIKYCNQCGDYQVGCDSIGIKPVCVKSCTVGCFCKKGFVYNRDNETCKSLDSCCTNKEYFETCEGKKNCIRGCKCKAGFMLNAMNVCV